jgi:hypothetical protein
VPNYGRRGAVNTNEVFELTIDKALTGNFATFESQVKIAFPEKVNDFT